MDHSLDKERLTEDKRDHGQLRGSAKYFQDLEGERSEIPCNELQLEP